MASFDPYAEHAPVRLAPAREDLWRRVPEHLWRRFPEVVPPEMLRSDSLVVAFGFKCNLACSFCLIEDMLDERSGTSLDAFRAFAADAEAMQGIDRIIFSGGEATLERDLAEYVAVARSTPGIRHVRVQTNGTRLKSRDYLRSLIDAGIDEFFVSMHAHDEPTCETVTRRKNSFRDIVAGLENVAASGATLLTNTVMVQQNHAHLSRIVEVVAPLRPARMEFWNLWPRIDHADERGHLVPVSTLAPRLHDALATCGRLEVPASVKWFPACLLGEYRPLLDNSQPTALIDLDYWATTPPHACLFEGVCSEAQSRWHCVGLSHSYVNRFGWEEETLVPLRTSQAGPSGHARPVVGVPVAELRTLALEPGVAFGPFRLEGATREGATLRLHFRSTDGAPFFVELLPRTAREPAFRRTASFDVRHGPSPGLDVVPALEALVAHLARHDRGPPATPA